MQPLSSITAQRLHNVDALRGFALLGILSVNIWAFADPHFAAGVGANPAFQAPLDHAVRFLVALLFESKFYLLFSFLFGYSFTLQMGAAQRAGASLKPRMLRRQAGLFALGLVHGPVLYRGDILTTYSLLGLILLACRDSTPQRAVRRAILLVTVSGGLLLGCGLLALWLVPPSGGGPAMREVQDLLAAFRGSAWQTLHYHLTHYATNAASALLAQGPSALAMFFLGYAAGRQRLLEQPGMNARHQRRLLALGLPAGLAGAAYYAATAQATAEAPLLLGFGVTMLTAPFMTAAYVIGMLRLFATGAGQRLQRALAPMGRMALSNYLSQSLIMSLLFTGYGLGWINRLAPAAVMACVAVIYGVQLLWSRWWLARFAYGPVEWLLRAVTTASLPRWRPAAPDSAAGALPVRQ